MFKYLPIFCVLIHFCLTQDLLGNKTDINTNEVNSNEKQLNDKELPNPGIQDENRMDKDLPNPEKQDEVPMDKDLPNPEKRDETPIDKELEYRPSDEKQLPPSPESMPPNGENQYVFCDPKVKEGYEQCKNQYTEITKGEQNSRKICCAIKTLQQCILPVLNQHCSLEAFNEMEKELHGINQICRIAGSRYCPKVERPRT